MRALLVFLPLVLAACPSDDTADDPAADTGSGSVSTGSDSSTGTQGPAAGSDSDSSSEGGSASSTADSTGAAGLCANEFPAIVTDIDETLTTADGEFFMQLQDGNYDPLERDGGATLINTYADLGYRVLYLTARSQTWVTEVTDETAREATMRWLQEHGYPVDPETTELVLAPMIVLGDAARMYKGDAIMGFQAEGWRFDYAYGNADTDIGGYEDAGISKETTFIIGEEAGNEGTVAIEGEGWLTHIDSHLPGVPEACGDDG
ncbi:MAG: hypothetical protein JKY37_15675 [Nannocystaceae bacterium]|nr:hypothetical protein [Nannocystaceae bacterium]